MSQLKLSHLLGPESDVALLDEEGHEHILPFEEFSLLLLPALRRYRGCDLGTPEGWDEIRARWRKEQERAEREYNAILAEHQTT